MSLSASAAQRRLKRLKEAGVIRQEGAVVSHEAVVCTFKDMPEYEAFSRTMFVKAPNVVSFQTSVVITPLKMTLQVPAD